MTPLKVTRTLFISLLFVGTLVESQRSDIRLVGGLNDHEGRVEVRIDGEWGTVCDDGWNLTDATVACRQLGFGAATDATTNARQFGEGSGPIHLDEVACNGDEVSLVSCGHRGLGVNNCGHSEDAGVSCSTEPPTSGKADIELEGGDSPLEGRIRINIGGEWGTVCDDQWDLADASVACQQLDLGTAVDVQSFGPGGGTIFLDDLDCVGTESSLTSCGYINKNNCNHGEDAGAVCSGYTETQRGHQGIRLVGGSSEYEGRVEVYIDGQWGTVCDDLWTLTDANVACRQLGFGPATSTPGQASYGEGSGSILMDNVECNGHESSLASCPYVRIHNCGHFEDAGIVCGLPGNSTKAQVNQSTIRLVGGSSNYEGRVEVYIDGQWGTVCDDLWTLTDANVACRQLGFGPATSAPGQASFGEGSGSIVMDNVGCNGHESLLASCSYLSSHNCGHAEDAGIVCSSSGTPEPQVNQSTIRLVGGSSKYEGRVEVYIDGQWGTVCDDLWTLADANVACRQLGFGPATSAPGQASFGQGSGSIVMDNVGCNGHETSLAFCQYSREHNCGHSEDAGIVCSSSGTSELQVKQSTIRLVGGSSNYEGRVEVYLDGQWGTVCDDLWTLTDANVACRQLGFGSATSAPGQALFGRGIGSILMDNVECRGDEVSLKSCRHDTSHNCGHQEDAGIVCSAQSEASSIHRSIRLVGSSSPYEGRVELLIAGEWGTVCDDMWDINDAMVACRQLGYGQATGARTSARYGPGTGPIHLDDLQCAGGESMLISCRHAGNAHNCNHGEDAGLVCLPPDAESVEPPTEPEVSIRLVGGFSQYEGRLEVYIDGRWGTVCDDLWTMADTDVACRQLGLGSAVSIRSSTYGDGSGRILMDNVECTGIEADLISCQYSSTHNCRHSEDVGIICNEPDGTHAAGVRLVGGSSDNEGRVEIFINGQWGTVCDDLWDITDANVVCSQLGYGVASAIRDSSIYGEGTGQILMDNVECDGTEESLISCAHSGAHNCRHEEDVGIICHPQGTQDLPIRLVGGTTEFEGRVEVYMSKQWGTVCDDLWDMTDANVACRQLGYGKATAIRNSNGFGQATGTILMDDVQCLGDETSLIACPHTSSHNCGHLEDAGIACEPPVVVTTDAPDVECPSLGRTNHPLKIICTNVTNEGSVCTYSCDDGFTLQGTSERTCQSTGSWSPTEEATPTCEAEVVTIAPVVECAALDRANYPLTVSCTNDTREGSMCTYSCADGFSLKGSSERTCQSTGSWSQIEEETPTCEDVSCPPLKLEHGETHCTNDWMYLSACMPICDLGFKLNRQPVLQCSSAGNWTNELPTCHISKCPELPVVANGVTECTQDTHFRSVCNITCAEGFRLEGPESRECEAIGSWSAFQPICQDIRCPSLTSPHFGSLSCSQGSRHGSVCNSTCGVGYRTIGSKITTCNTNGTWTKDLPTCELIRCDPQVEAPQNGNVNCFHSARVCIYSCNDGFDLTPRTSIVRTCEADGWSGTLPTCIDRRGPVFRNCPDDAMSFISDPTLDTATVNWPAPSALDHSNKKIIGTHISGPTPGSSLQGGFYPVIYTAEDSNGNTATCEFVVVVSVIRCPELSDEGLVTVDCFHGYLRDSICRFSCSMAGYDVVGPDMTQCVVDGDVASWSTARPSCTDYTAPVFTDCPSSQIVFAEFNQTTAIVRWSHPRATDNSDNVLRVEMTSGNGSGSVRSEGTILESYEAVDESGNVAQCNFNVTVKVIRCTEPQLDSDVISTCSGTVLGSVCHLSCPEGYALQGHSSTSCQRNGFDGIWSNQLPSCLDNQAPVFTRGPEPMEVISAPLETTAFVDWEVPTVEDQDPNVEVVQIAGPAPQNELNEGFYLVRYKAVDSAGNGADYTFNITVKVIRCNDPEPEVNEDIEVICNHGNLFGSTCVYSCSVGFDVIGSQTTTCVMVDGETGSWNTTTTPTCQARSCPPLPVSPVATISGCETGLGNSTTYGTNCTFSCPAGYIGVGEAVKFCQADGSWSTTDFICQRRQCIGLGSNGIFTTTPHECMGFPGYGDVCVVSCLLPGYQLQGPGSAEFQCMENGTWDQALDEFTCLDIEPPELLTCPEPFIVSITNPEGVDVNFDLPTARDNSNGSLRVVTSPDNLTSPYYITQDTEFSYEFFDGANNSIKCTFGVFVKEEFGVDILYCPEDITVETEKEANVTWSQPQFRGENASHIEVTSTVNGTSAMLQIGVHSIEYTAVNKFSGKESVCRFNVTVNPPPCPPLDSPLNGALSCRTWPTIEICSMSCMDEYDIPRLPTRQQPPTLYTCSASQGSSREWKPNNNVVDCSKIKEERMYLPADLIYYNGDCGELVTQQTMASALASLIQASAFGDLCKDQQCSVTDVTVTCGPLDSSLLPPPAQRRRRMIRGDAIPVSSDGERRNIPRASRATNVTRISFDIETRNDFNESVDEPTNNADDRLAEIEEKLATLIQEIMTGTATGIEADMVETIAELSLHDPSLVLGDIQSACDEGYVPQTGAANRCVACPRGYFSSEDTYMCMPCSLGSYQDKSAQYTCKLCPLGQTTAKEGAKSIDECQDKCSPGFFSPSGLVPCLPCDRQSYQSQAGQTSCDLCPTNQKTSRYGAISDTECNL